MIRVTIDIIPKGDESAKFTARVVEIGNITRAEDMGDSVHQYEVREKAEACAYTDRRWFRHDRRDGLETCVSRGLAALYGPREGERGA